MNIKIYTDGGCSGNPGPGGWAYVILAVEAPPKRRAGTIPRRTTKQPVEQVIAEKFGAEENTTNNRMELVAVIKALEKLGALDTEGTLEAGTLATRESLGTRAKREIVVYTDSQYVQKGITEWILLWKKRNWLNSYKEPVKNRDLWQKLDTLASRFPITWQWVKGHAGDLYNERCDLMTQEAVRSL